MPRLAVLGQPVGHSRSPAMQSAALAELGLAGEWTYEAIEVAPQRFAELVRSLPDQGFAGVNVTVPHKLAALAVADRASSAAREIGAANTLSFGGGAIAAENTDASGLIEALPGPARGLRALVLGAGGAGRACAWALREAGADVAIWNRAPERAADLARELGVEHAREAESFDLLVNATTVGLAQASADTQAPNSSDLKPLPVSADALSERHVVVDLVYGPSPTPLAEAALSRGACLVDGIEILVRQGAASLRIWTGLEPPLETMRTAAREI
jgi:shikimate dehydrogenase